jgi:hypothetical protein
VRKLFTRFSVCSDCGAPGGITTTSAADASGLTCAGVTWTPATFDAACSIASTGVMSPAWGSATARNSGPFSSAPNPSVIRS